ncbi:hypothetical protein PR202_ga00352 [Eleusine coracana subsp. coracana]|uniref:phosphoglycerate kinase n=1 Tax=Eleusine coracana subsp. coracana TaxID=191504 RepID=A0AAV5BC86_ELECO|nr:hypothetical protein PR202_ga00352 [Eleusine coracana subsp. coracana]
MQACNFQGSSSFLWLEPRPPFGLYRVARRSDKFLGGQRRSILKCTILCCELQHSTNSVYLQKATLNVNLWSLYQATSYLHVQSLRKFPIEKLDGEVVVVRLDSSHLMGPLGPCNLSLKKTLLTIKYLYEARAKVVIVTSWDTVLQSDNPVLMSTEALAGAAIFVNDSFSLSHKILASTVGITRFCYASLAGFQFEEELKQLLTITDTTRRPYIAIIGGSNFLRNLPALHILASLCDGLFFVGKISFQIMNGLGISVPSHFVERHATTEVLQFIHDARARNIRIYYPTDMWCLNNDDNEKMRIFNSSDLTCGELDTCGYRAINVGENIFFITTLQVIKILNNLSHFLFLFAQKILWIGPTNYDLTRDLSVGVTYLGQILEKVHSDICDIILVGSAACTAVKGTSDSSFRYTKFQNASVVWEFLKGRILPGIAALDKDVELEDGQDDDNDEEDSSKEKEMMGHGPTAEKL